MLKIERTTNGETVLAVIGQLQSDNVGELSTVLDGEGSERALALDLKSLVFADRQAIRFLQQCQSKGISLRNCPNYISVWIAG